MYQIPSPSASGFRKKSENFSSSVRRPISGAFASVKLAIWQVIASPCRQFIISILCQKQKLNYGFSPTACIASQMFGIQWCVFIRWMRNCEHVRFPFVHGFINHAAYFRKRIGLREAAWHRRDLCPIAADLRLVNDDLVDNLLCVGNCFHDSPHSMQFNSAIADSFSNILHRRTVTMKHVSPTKR